MKSSDTIGVYGPTGYTGKLVVKQLAASGSPFVLIGRNEKKLRELKRQLGVKAPVKQAAIDDPSALRRAFDDCRVIINCAGPFTSIGEPVMHAAIEVGTHYLDTTGEQPFIKKGFDDYDAAAKKAEVTVVSGMGFDYVFGDMLAGLVAADVEPLTDLTIAYAVDNFAASQGTLLSGLEMLAQRDLIYEDKEWKPAGRGPLRAKFNFPDPVGKRQVVRYPAGEIITVPRHVDTDGVRVLIDAGAIAPHPKLGSLVPLFAPGASLAMKSPASFLAKRVIRQLPEGPNEQQRSMVRCMIAVVADGKAGQQRSGVLECGDGYDLTAVTIVLAAKQILLKDSTYTGLRGVVSPAMAFKAKDFLQILTKHGVTYTLDRVKQSKKR